MDALHYFLILIFLVALADIIYLLKKQSLQEKSIRFYQEYAKSLEHRLGIRGKNPVVVQEPYWD